MEEILSFNDKNGVNGLQSDSTVVKKEPQIEEEKLL